MFCPKFRTLFSYLVAGPFQKRTLRKHAYSNTLKISSPKTESFQIKTNTLHIVAQNMDCGYSLEPPGRGGSNEYPQSRFLSRNKKNNIYPYKSQFFYIKVGFKRVRIIKACFRDEFSTFHAKCLQTDNLHKILKSFLLGKSRKYYFVVC